MTFKDLVNIFLHLIFYALFILIVFHYPFNDLIIPVYQELIDRQPDQPVRVDSAGRPRC